MICGIVQDRALLRRAGRAAHRRRPGGLPRLGRARPSGPAILGAGRGAAAPDPVRRAVRALGGRVDGLRDAGGRVPEGLDAGSGRRGRDRTPGRRRRRGGRRGRRDRGRSTGRGCAARARERFCGGPDGRRLPARFTAKSSAEKPLLLTSECELHVNRGNFPQSSHDSCACASRCDARAR